MVKRAAQLPHNIIDHPIVRRGRRCQHRQVWRERSQDARRFVGSPDENRAPSPRCNGPRPRTNKPILGAIGSRERVMNSSLARRSGDTSRMSIWSALSACFTRCHSLGLVELMVFRPYIHSLRGFDLVTHQREQG